MLNLWLSAPLSGLSDSLASCWLFCVLSTMRLLLLCFWLRLSPVHPAVISLTSFFLLTCSSLCVNYSACVYPGLSVPSCQIDFTLVLAYLVSSKGPVVCLPGSCQPGFCLFLDFACGSALCLLPDFSSEDFSSCLFFLCLDCYPVSVYSGLVPFLCFCNLPLRPDFRWSFQVPCHKQTTN